MRIHKKSLTTTKVNSYTFSYPFFILKPPSSIHKPQGKKIIKNKKKKKKIEEKLSNLQAPIAKLSQYCIGKVEENMDQWKNETKFRHCGPTSPGTREATFPSGASYLHETWR
jgi:hypothetical protein